METSARSHVDAAPAPRPRTRYGKIKLRNIDDLDQRTNAAQATRRHIQNLTNDLAADRGGEARLSQAERMLVQRACVIGAICDDHEARWVAGEPIALTDYLQCVAVQRRLLQTLGIRKAPLDLDAIDGTCDPAVELYRRELHRNGDASD
jgi:hypothetical protein